MPGKKFKLKPQEDAAVSHARRKETVRGALKPFRVLLDAAKRHAEWAEDRHGLAGAQLWALWELRQTPGMRAVDLARSMAIHRRTAETVLCELVGLDVVGLKRIRIGKVKLGDLPLGQWRYLRQDEAF